MRDQTEDETNQQAEPVDPYGDVALGVECAWPQNIPMVQATPSDVVLQAGESFRLARPGLAIVEAFGDASISIR